MSQHQDSSKSSKNNAFKKIWSRRGLESGRSAGYPSTTKLNPSDEKEQYLQKIELFQEIKQHEASPAKMTAFEALNAASNGGIGFESTSNHVTENSSPQKLPPRMYENQHQIESRESLHQP